ncbi:X-Pro dipeptidyl-peptidase C-terminal non-catalytic domain-containing protein [Cadophora sp. DSE1049]|nr:X-Pro dipeptidyl-peptidase C-terminal non-catalytic domain-containing protein [Cadophora sp. DSE1049]
MQTTSARLHTRFPDLEFAQLPLPSEHPHFFANGFEPCTTVLPAGHFKAEGRKPFSVDVIFDRDTAIPMRDGIRIYVDIFRPIDSDTAEVPALIPWSSYGKTGTGPQQYDTMAPFRAGIAVSRTSGYEKFEAPDPAEWCGRGYAVVNVDARGAGASEGNIAFWGEQEAEDIYDTIEWLSAQPWCNGSVCMAGNSWLSIAQINFASRLSHPALKAFAPWESLNDPYRDLIARGGMPVNSEFHKLLIRGFAGPNSVENLPAMIQKRPLFEDYWESKQIKTENIRDVPIYLVASYSSMLHNKGSFETFRTAQSRSKWLRVHPYQEWYDLYRPEINDDLQRFFDRYCKGIENGWEHDTPPVRLSLLAFEGSQAETVLERPEQEYPLARQQLQKYYVNALEMTLQSERPSSASTVSHAGHDLNASSDFTLYFDKQTELVGYSSVHLWVSCAEHNDLDVVVQIRKISASGTLLEHLNYPCPVPVDEVPNLNTAKTLGPQGFLRASHAISRVDAKTNQNEFFYQHDRREYVSPGTVVPLDITLWPIGMVFTKGEGLMLRISGHDMSHPEVELVRPIEATDANVGTHIVHTGGQYDSYLILPVIPEA